MQSVLTIVNSQRPWRPEDEDGDPLTLRIGYNAAVAGARLHEEPPEEEDEVDFVREGSCSTDEECGMEEVEQIISPDISLQEQIVSPDTLQEVTEKAIPLVASRALRKRKRVQYAGDKNYNPDELEDAPSPAKAHIIEERSVDKNLSKVQKELEIRSASNNRNKPSSLKDADKVKVLIMVDDRKQKVALKHLNDHDSKQTAASFIKDSVSKTDEKSAPSDTEVSKDDFEPVNLIESILPEIFKQRFPKAVNFPDKYICMWCKRHDRSEINKAVFRTVYQLVRHYHRWHSQIPVKDYGVQCEKCKAHFFHDKRLEDHIKHGQCFVHSAQKDYQMEGRFLTKDANMEVCPFCHMVFLSKKRFKKHLNKEDIGCRFQDMEHPMEMGMFDYMKCKYCEQNYLFEDDLEFHQKPFSNRLYRELVEPFKCRGVSRPIFTCTVCSVEYESKARFDDHITYDHKVEEFNIKCDRCDKYFYNESSRSEHSNGMKYYPFCLDFDKYRTVPKRPETELGHRFKCPITDGACNNFTNNKGSASRFYKHMGKYHPDYKYSACSDCDKTFLSVWDYEDHITKWKCPFCERLFPSKRGLVDHCRSTHEELKPAPETEAVECEECGKVFGNRYLLELHLTAFHRELDECPFCGETDTQRLNLYKHIQSYHAYRTPPDVQYPCILCEKKILFSTKDKLSRHVNDVHHKASQSECDLCHKVFAQRATMMRHRRIHLDIKPFKCTICGVQFTQKTGMKAHKARHYNSDGSMKSQEEIDQQVEVIKQQRAGLQSGEGKKKKKQTPSKGKKKHTCEACGGEFKTKKELSSHDCADVSAGEDEGSEEGDTEPEPNFESGDEGKPEEVEDYNFRCDKCGRGFATVERKDSHRCRRRKVGVQGFIDDHLESDDFEAEASTGLDEIDEETAKYDLVANDPMPKEVRTKVQKKRTYREREGYGKNCTIRREYPKRSK